MNRLTPNLWAYSAFEGTITPNLLETRELDFNLARRSAIIINQIISQMFYTVNTTTGHELTGHMINELDTDPDNIDIEFGGDRDPDGVVLDSSRVMRHVAHWDIETAAGRESPIHTLLLKDFTGLSEAKRPISITPLRHHWSSQMAIAGLGSSEIGIDYFIVELSLEEIGILNASRR